MLQVMEKNEFKHSQKCIKEGVEEEPAEEEGCRHDRKVTLRS